MLRPGTIGRFARWNTRAAIAPPLSRTPRCRWHLAAGAALLLFAGQPAFAGAPHDWATASDVGVGGLVLWSSGVPAATGDTQGALQAGASAALGLGAAQGLKQVFPERRPEGSGNDSFPSGHTATAFAAATSILDRRGDRVGLGPVDHPAATPDAPKVFARGDFHSAGVPYAARF